MEASDTAGAGVPDVLRLKIVSGNAAGDTVEVQDEFVIGRQAPGAGTLANDIEISRTHARIWAEADGRFVIEDLGSTNGTYVNGRRVDVPTALEVGDRIEVGSSALVVQVGAIQPTPPSSETVVPPPPEPSTDVAAPAGPAAPAVPAAPAEPLPPFSLRIEVDPVAGRATVALDEGAEQVGLVLVDGRWVLER